MENASTPNIKRENPIKGSPDFNFLTAFFNPTAFI